MCILDFVKRHETIVMKIHWSDLQLLRLLNWYKSFIKVNEQLNGIRCLSYYLTVKQVYFTLYQIKVLIYFFTNAKSDIFERVEHL